MSSKAFEGVYGVDVSQQTIFENKGEPVAEIGRVSNDVGDVFEAEAVGTKVLRKGGAAASVLHGRGGGLHAAGPASLRKQGHHAQQQQQQHQPAVRRLPAHDGSLSSALLELERHVALLEERCDAEFAAGSAAAAVAEMERVLGLVGGKDALSAVALALNTLETRVEALNSLCVKSASGCGYTPLDPLVHERACHMLNLLRTTEPALQNISQTSSTVFAAGSRWDALRAQVEALATPQSIEEAEAAARRLEDLEEQCASLERTLDAAIAADAEKLEEFLTRHLSAAQ